MERNVTSESMGRGFGSVRMRKKFREGSLTPSSSAKWLAPAPFLDVSIVSHVAKARVG